MLLGSRAWFFFACLLLVPWQLWHVANHSQFLHVPLPTGDGPDYETIGYSLSVGKGFAFAWDDPEWKRPYLADEAADQYPHLKSHSHNGTTTLRPPFFPIVISTVYRFVGRGEIAFAFIRSLSALSIAIAGSLAVLIAFEIVSRTPASYWVRHVAAGGTLLLALLDSNTRRYAADFLTEPFALLWTTIFVTVAIKLDDEHPKTKSIVLGIVMAAMIATRTIAIGWVPGVMLLLYWTTPKLKSRASLYFLLTLSLLLSPWWIRNCYHLGSFMPMGAQGPTSILGGYSTEALNDDGNWHPDAEQRLRESVKDKHWTSLESERQLAILAAKETRTWIAQNFAHLPTLMTLRIKSHWGPYFGQSLIWRFGMLLGVIALIIYRRREAYWMLGLPFIGTITVMLLYETGGRFLVPLYGLLYALAGIGVAMAISKSVSLSQTIRLPGRT
ncbi:MAG: hypothetical protein SGI77_01965 [Pirellulaceae bacterium]|nr:hypothetical protein [Pirellulaceae bacterium]